MYRLFSTVALLLQAEFTFAGLVFEIETRNLTTTPPTMERTLVYAEGQLLKMENGDQRGRTDAVVFRGDRREMLLVDHERQSYQLIDSQFIEQMAGQLTQAREQMQGMLDRLPADQQSLVDRMSRNQGGVGNQPSRPRVVVQQTGKREQVYGYPCELFDIQRDGRKVRSVWVTNWENIRGSRDLAQTFVAMSDLFSELTASLPMQGSAPVEDNVFATLRQLGGFPVATLEYDLDGNVKNETALRSAKPQSLGLEVFEAPANYRFESMAGGMSGSQSGQNRPGRR